MIGPKENIHLLENFIKSHKLAVISTVTHDGKPQSAVVGFAELPDLVLLFGTFVSSRKYSNLKQNPLVSFVIGWEGGKTAQYEGEAEEITDEQEIAKFKETYIAKVPTVVKFINHHEERFFKVHPKWVRYTDVSKDPWDMFEIKF